MNSSKLIAGMAVAAGVLTGSAACARDAPPDTYESFWSRVTVTVPLFTQHVPSSRGYNDHNWGAWVNVAINRQWSVVGGDFLNSYNKNTAFAGVAWMPFNWDLSHARIDLGLMAGADLNGGYKHVSSVDPLLGALALTIRGANFSDGALLNRLGITFTVIPSAGRGGSVPLNLAVSFQL